MQEGAAMLENWKIASLKDFKFNLWSNGGIFPLNIWDMDTLWWYLDVFQASRL